MKTVDVKKVLEFNESVSENMNGYLEKYVDWVKRNVKGCHWHKFKVGLVVECPNVQGRWYGLKGDCYNRDTDTWSVGYNTIDFNGYAWNQFGYYVSSLSRKEKMDYVKNIPSIIENALKEIQEESDEFNGMEKIDFDTFKVDKI